MTCYICGNDCIFCPNYFDGGYDPDTGHHDEIILCDACAATAIDRNGTLDLSISDQTILERMDDRATGSEFEDHDYWMDDPEYKERYEQ
jgi:hypothetical protein